MMDEEFTTDGCSAFPDLWIYDCCVQHDYAYFIGTPNAQADAEFFRCIIEASDFLGPGAYIFAVIVVGGLIIGRPGYRLYQRIFKKGIYAEKD
jgi:hypothetical protein